MYQPITRGAISTSGSAVIKDVTATDIAVIVPNNLHAEATRAVLNAITLQTTPPAQVIVVQASRYENSESDWSE